MRFRFTLQKVVDLKQNEKTQAEWMLTSALIKLREEEASLRELKQIQSTFQLQMTEAATQSTSIQELQEIQHYVTYLDQVIEHKGLDVQHAQGEVNVKQQGLTSKMLEEKVWLKARERAYHVHQDESRKREQNELDEIASVRFGDRTG